MTIDARLYGRGDLLRDVGGLDVRHVSIEGNQAIARTVSDSGDDTIRLVKDGPDWKIDAESDD